jgi:putative ABC transport system substrate-binding protein
MNPTSPTILGLTRKAVLAAVLLGAPAKADELPVTPRIGVLMPASSVGGKALLDGLRALGYAEGENIVIDWRSSAGTEADLRSVVRDLARSKADLIVAGSTPAARAALDTTATPVVFIVGDPVTAGLATSLAKPGGNGTGVSLLTPQLTAKRLELLRLAAPRARRIAFVMNSANPNDALQLKEATEAARALDLELVVFDAHPGGIDLSLAQIPTSQTGGILIAADILFLENRAKIARAVRKSKVPAIFPATEYHDAEVLMSYGPNLTQANRRLAVYVDKILKGAKPSELPIEQLSKYELVIDLRVARAMGLQVPQELLLRADEVIR